MIEEMITGYQYGYDNSFRGAYKFPNNKDKDEIHVPPMTTLVAPPTIPEGSKAMWNGSEWTIEEVHTEFSYAQVSIRDEIIPNGLPVHSEENLLPGIFDSQAQRIS